MTACGGGVMPSEPLGLAEAVLASAAVTPVAMAPTKARRVESTGVGAEVKLGDFMRLNSVGSQSGPLLFGGAAESRSSRSVATMVGRVMITSSRGLTPRGTEAREAEDRLIEVILTDPIT